jgi:hypothetical protein
MRVFLGDLAQEAGFGWIFVCRTLTIEEVK